MRIWIFTICLITSLSVATAQIPWTPVHDLQLRRTVIDVPEKYAALDLYPGTNDVWLPEGWTANIFFAGQALNKPRFLAWGPDSVLFVANMSRSNVLAFPDKNRDGIADTVIIATKVPGTTSSITFHQDTLYVGSESGITKRWRSSGQGYIYDKSVTIVDKSSHPSQLGGNHRTRTVVVDTVHNKLYLSIGSENNADREPDRATIEEFEFDGSGGRVYATGIRNAVGLVLHPRTGQLWANNNGSDQQGNNIPPEWVDMIRPGGFYGYPFAYHVGNWFPSYSGGYSDLLPLTAADSALTRSMVPPAALITAHSAPMQMVFSHQGMPAPFRSGAFMALRGSWNRTPISGTKLVYLHFDSDQDTIANYVADFCTGFLVDSTNPDSRWARPVGVALAADGSIYLTSDDEKQFILHLKPPVNTSVPDHGSLGRPRLKVSPNPAFDNAVITLSRPIHGSVLIANALGEIVHREPIDGEQTRVSLKAVVPGTYTVIVTGSDGEARASLSVLR